MGTITLQEAQAQLPSLIHNLQPGEELVITENERPLAKLVGQLPTPRFPRQKGSAKGKLTIRIEDDEHLETFKEYMP
jgi:antitoxin (DNA-binding transcriptional repressor) of toxin-antitoxin stability system